MISRQPRARSLPSLCVFAGRPQRENGDIARPPFVLLQYNRARRARKLKGSLLIRVPQFFARWRERAARKTNNRVSGIRATHRSGHDNGKAFLESPRKASTRHGPPNRQRASTYTPTAYARSAGTRGA